MFVVPLMTMLFAFAFVYNDKFRDATLSGIGYTLGAALVLFSATVMSLPFVVFYVLFMT